MELSEARALVTGGGSGMGREFCLRLAEAGARVTFCDIDEPAIGETVRLAEGLPGEVSGIRADVGDEAEVSRLLDEAWEAAGTLNVLVNNAGIFRDRLLVRKDRQTGELRKLPLADWDAVIRVDLTGPFLCAREFAARVIESETRPAVIVNMSSAARLGNRGQTNYSAAKAGLVADTRLWADELSRFGIRTGAIAPGLVDTPILQAMPPHELEKLLSAVPLGRLGQPSEMFQALRFIIECEYFTGRCIDVDGGIKM